MYKSVKLEESLWNRLKVETEKSGLSMSDVIRNALDGLRPRTDLDKVFDQLSMINQRLDELSVEEDDILTTYAAPDRPETLYEKTMRERREAYEAQRYAVEHPEEEVQ